jgi:DNA-binding PadR family transcriptional regulator
VLDFAVLGLLREQPLHGYELKKRLGETLGSFWGVSFGSLYPALRRLERDGAIAVVEDLGDAELTGSPAPSTGSLAGDLATARLRRRPRPSRRHRKAYRITAAGEIRFAELLAADDTADDERSFALHLAFCGSLDPDARLAFLERRRAALLERLSKSRRARPTERVTDRYTRALQEHRARTTEHDLAFIDGLIEAERRSQLDDRPEGATA